LVPRESRFLNELKLSERAHASLKLLEASGRPVDLRAATTLVENVYVLIGAGIIALLSLLAFWALLAKYMLLRGELEDTRALMNQGSLVQPATKDGIAREPGSRPASTACADPQ
jgi:hypothetical protein